MTEYRWVSGTEEVNSKYELEENWKMLHVNKHKIGDSSQNVNKGNLETEFL